MFTPPTPGLDPNLFEGDRLLPAVRSWVTDTGYRFLNTHYKGAHNWATIWIAGSGASHQWSADRSPRDLDILVGVKMLSFKRHNPEYKGVDDTTIARLVTQTFRTLAEQTANQQIGTATYEVTWYVNPGAADIRDIHPYAAYDVTHDTWTVRPPDLPPDWGTRYFPQEWWQQVGREKRHAHEIVSNFLANRAHYLSTKDPAMRVNAAQGMQYNAAMAETFFTDLHSNRRAAFGPEGRGYSDWNNFRWQAHKRFGTVQAMHALAALKEEADKQSQEEIYGHPLASTEQAMSTAALLHAHLGALEMR